MMASRIRCFYDDCAYLAKGYCTSLTVELDPEDGCLTYTDEAGSDSIALDSSEADTSDEDDWDEAGFEEVDEIDIDEDYEN